MLGTAHKNPTTSEPKHKCEQHKAYLCPLRLQRHAGANVRVDIRVNAAIAALVRNCEDVLAVEDRCH